MKLIGSLTSPYVRKIRVQLIEKGIAHDLIVDSPWEPATHVPDYNPLGKVPALVTDTGETLFDSNILSEYIELTWPEPALLPADRAAALRVRQIVLLADGIADAGVAIFLENKRPPEKQQADWTARQTGKVERGLAALSAAISARPDDTSGMPDLAEIATGCALLWLSFRLPQIDWRGQHPALAALLDRLNTRPSFQQTAPPV